MPSPSPAPERRVDVRLRAAARAVAGDFKTALMLLKPLLDSPSDEDGPAGLDLPSV